MGPWFIAPQLFGDLPVTGVSRPQNALWVERLEVINDPTVNERRAERRGVRVAARVDHVLGGAHRPSPGARPHRPHRALDVLRPDDAGDRLLRLAYVLDDIAGLLIGGIAVVVGALLTGNREALRRRPREETALSAPTTSFSCGVGMSAQGFAIPDAASVRLQVPNVLTVFRIALVPLLVLAIAEDPDGSALAVAIFVLAAATDVADGRIARLQEVVSTFGKLADPIADKLLIGGALVALAVSDQVATWIVVVVLGRELAVTLLRWHAKREGIIVPASIWGKAKMVLQCAALVALLAVPGAAWVNALLYVTVAATVVSGIDYALHLRGSAPIPAPSAWLYWIWIMPKYKVEFSDNTTTLPEHELDFPNVGGRLQRREGDRQQASGSWHVYVWIEFLGLAHDHYEFRDGKTVAEFPLEEHEDTPPS